ncbi:enolase [Kipferlia bialata]|uniref:phosphopyruvate hydratase n=1 Tax=Kipferlia bialata TaxID=797122 RepID=A0A9K3GES8_9EUKA|nr:enolase [Kipferlia bialata]|eukprot:g216.t1
MSTIQSIKARQIYDSRGNPTTEVDITTKDGMFRAACPSGASTGEHEALELRDGTSQWHGKSVFKAIKNIEEVFGPAVMGMDVTDQKAIDAKLLETDGTPHFSNYGANAALPISMAVARAGAAALGKPLYAHLGALSGRTDVMRTPVPCMNIINGGKHAGNALAPQEYMIAPFGAKDFAEAMRMGSEVYHHLKSILKKAYGIGSTSVGDEGGFAPPINNPRAPLEVIMEAVKVAGYEGKVGICMDTAASEFYNKETKMYNLNFKGEEANWISGAEMADMYMEWCREFPIISIEDPFDENDFESFAVLLAKVKAAGLPTQIVGDDLTVSQAERVQDAINKKACNSLLLKVNQVGTVTGAIEATLLAMSDDWSVMVSHRSGETEDVFIADLVCGLGTGQIKTGAPCRSERTAKLNQMLRIEEETGMPFGFDSWTA